MSNPTDPTAATGLGSWLPDLSNTSLAALAEVPAQELAEAIEALLGRVRRPLATIAGSSGS